MIPVLDKLAEKYNLLLNREQAIVAKVIGLSLTNSDTLDVKRQIKTHFLNLVFN